jgi:hypothetical protein
VRLVDRRGADGLLSMVKELVNEDQTGPDGDPAYDTIVSTVHKAKGREWREVGVERSDQHARVVVQFFRESQQDTNFGQQGGDADIDEMGHRLWL